ncbi:maleate cis-trans isomerase family protein [Halorientalis salina]|uniref:maleate cis-trans isomerase family protein n=1 Tax=Halorientalis salina TaxID=2932266 RepID=UPI0010AC99B1|nr:aspartate/glutamate racemase family protein [Halorientalis salina]
MTTRLGLVVPSSNTTAEPEFAAATPDDVTRHAARMPLADVTADALDEMADGALDAADRLADAGVDGVAYACTTGSLLHGASFARDLESRLGAAVDAPAVVTALSVRRALDYLDATKVAVVTPYVDDLNERERRFLVDAGFEVVTLDGRGIVDNTEIGALTPEDAVEQVRTAVDADTVDAVFVSCTNYNSLPAIERLEAEIGVPVVTSNQATAWDLCRSVDLPTTEIPGALGDE